MSGEKRLVVGISGASGAPLAVACLKELRRHEQWETHLIISRSGAKTISHETNMSLHDVQALADVCYDEDETGAAPASGSFRTEGMLVVPCSMKTAAGICSGYSDNLLLRAADVTIKERRPLVLAPREAPLSPIHLRNLTELSRMPAVSIIPPVMSFYAGVGSIYEMLHGLVCRLLLPFGIECEGYKRWCGYEDN